MRSVQSTREVHKQQEQPADQEQVGEAIVVVAELGLLGQHQRSRPGWLGLGFLYNPPGAGG